MRLQVAVLPQSSVAVHVRVVLYVPTHEPGVVASTKVMVTVASQASVAVGGVNTGKAGQSTGDVCATQVIVGGIKSSTTMVPLHDAVLPQSSVAVQVRVVLYVPTHDPGVVASANVIVTVASQASVAVGGVNTGRAGQVCRLQRLARDRRNQPDGGRHHRPHRRDHHHPAHVRNDVPARVQARRSRQSRVRCAGEIRGKDVVGDRGRGPDVAE